MHHRRRPLFRLFWFISNNLQNKNYDRLQRDSNSLTPWSPQLWMKWNWCKLWQKQKSWNNQKFLLFNYFETFLNAIKTSLTLKVILCHRRESFWIVICLYNTGAIFSAKGRRQGFIASLWRTLQGESLLIEASSGRRRHFTATIYSITFDKPKDNFNIKLFGPSPY